MEKALGARLLTAIGGVLRHLRPVVVGGTPDDRRPAGSYAHRTACCPTGSNPRWWFWRTRRPPKHCCRPRYHFLAAHPTSTSSCRSAQAMRSSRLSPTGAPSLNTADTVDSGRLECSALRPDRLVVIVPAGYPSPTATVAFSACLDYLPGIHPGKSAGTPEWPNLPSAFAPLPGASAQRTQFALRSQPVSASPSFQFGRRAVAVSRSTHRRPDNAWGSLQSAAVLPRSAAIIQSCCRIQRASGIGRMSDYPGGMLRPSSSC
jgi:hypothetical protein